MDYSNNPRVYVDSEGNMYVDGVEVHVKEVVFEDTKSMNAAYRDLKNSFDLGAISAEQFYSELELLRNFYLEEGSAAWWKYTKQILSYEQSLAEEQIKLQMQMAEEKTDKLSAMYSLGLISAKEYYEKLGNVRDEFFESGTPEWENFSVELAKFYSKQLEQKNKSADNLTDRLAGGIMQLVRIKDQKGKITDEFYRLTTPDVKAAEKYFEGFEFLKSNGAPPYILEEYLSMSANKSAQYIEALGNIGTDLPTYFSKLSDARGQIQSMANELYGTEFLSKAITEIIQSLKDAGFMEGVEITQNFYGTGISPSEVARETVNSLKLQGVSI